MSESRMRSPSAMGYFDDLESARKAIKELRAFGFDPSRVGCALATVEDPETPGLWTRVLRFFFEDSPGSRFATSLDCLRIPYPDQRSLEEKLAEHGALVIVFDPQRAELAARILNACGAEFRRRGSSYEAKDRRLRIKLIGKCADCLEQAA